MKTFIKWVCILFVLTSAGCSWVRDFPRTVWGSSVRVLSGLRDQGRSAVFACESSACFQAVSELTVSFASRDQGDGRLIRFAADPDQRYLIVMGVPGSVDTTEVGVFFETTLEEGATKIVISSLSSRARDVAARIVFDALSGSYEKVL